MFKFQRNMGTLDRVIRVIVGIALLIIGPATDLLDLVPVLEVILGVMGVFAILSAVFSYCLLYELTDTNTAK